MSPGCNLKFAEKAPMGDAASVLQMSPIHPNNFFISPFLHFTILAGMLVSDKSSRLNQVLQPAFDGRTERSVASRQRVHMIPRQELALDVEHLAVVFPRRAESHHA
ncbi:hypothetical protein SeMB42_g03216 [Synchytrium endobioticum]|uniref:Uncharacterized protein n=1 Tax=Synchytrium endobioticum TaxID=286115 RepID=A0A507DA81_9FUNG|nr:hypothetical protein SeMB42_g03216 [Synchytrium endobioticum]